ncbi:hypothetical protein PGB90_001303 [Kerria lacca]
MRTLNPIYPLGNMGMYGNVSVIDTVSPEMLHLIDPQWYQWPPINPLWHKILMLFMCILGFLSFFGNGLVVYVFTTTKSLRTPSNLYVVNLAFSDFCMMFCMCPAMVINCYHETWSFGPFACALYGMTGSLFGNTSIWTMIFIALDRYNVIVKVGFKRQTAYDKWSDFKYSIYLDARAIMDIGTDVRMEQVALMTISLWFMAWTPYLIINYSGIFQLMNISPLTTIWGSVFAKANAIYNPIVYAISHPKYRQALDKKIPTLVCGKVTHDSDTQSNVSQVTN